MMSRLPASENRNHSRRITELKVSGVEAGISLVELLIAMSIGLILIAGMIAVFQGNKRSNDLNTSMADIQESARFAMGRLADEIRMSGFQGCIDINSGSAVMLAKSKPTSDLHASAAYASVIGSGNSWAPAPPDGFDKSRHAALPGTHALVLQFADPATYPLYQQVTVGGAPDRTGPVIADISPGLTTRQFDLKTGEYAVISNCSLANIFRISSISTNGNLATIGHNATMNDSASLSSDFGDANSLRETKVMRFQSNVYYIADTGIVNEQGNSITALYQQSLPYSDNNNPPRELIRGIENLRVSFGIRTGKESLTYMQPDDAAFDARQVESVRLGLLMSSHDSVAETDDTNTYVLAGQAIHPPGQGIASSHAGDKRHRLAFNTTVKIRNRRNTMQ